MSYFCSDFRFQDDTVDVGWKYKIKTRAILSENFIALEVKKAKNWGCSSVG